MSDYYILDDQRRVQPAELMQWAKFYNTDQRIVAQITLAGGVFISTVFVGIPLNFGSGPPLVFETMVFELTMDGDSGRNCWRYATWDDAEVGHKAIVRRVEKQLAEIAMPVLPGTKVQGS